MEAACGVRWCTHTLDPKQTLSLTHTHPLPIIIHSYQCLASEATFEVRGLPVGWQFLGQ